MFINILKLKSEVTAIPLRRDTLINNDLRVFYCFYDPYISIKSQTQ